MFCQETNTWFISHFTLLIINLITFLRDNTQSKRKHLDLEADLGNQENLANDNDVESNGAPITEPPAAEPSIVQNTDPKTRTDKSQIPKPQALAMTYVPSSSNQIVDERLVQILQSDSTPELVEDVKYFLGNHGAANLEDPEQIRKVYNYIANIKPYAIEEESRTLAELEAQMDTIPRL